MDTLGSGNTKSIMPFDLVNSEDIHDQASQLDTWHQEYSQLSSGQFEGSISSIGNNQFRLFNERMNLSVLQKGMLKSDELGVGVMVSSEGHSIICGEEVTNKELVVFSGDSGFEFLSPDHFEFIGIEIRKEETGHKVMHDLLLERLSSNSRAIVLKPGEANRFALNITSAMQVLQKKGTLANNCRALDMVHRQIVGSLIGLFAEEEFEDLEPCNRSHYWSIICDIRDLVLSNPECPMTVAELAVHLDLSTRSIRTVCQETLGISPHYFLRALRLSEVRREIKYTKSVTEAATCWGFWHFGYFSRDYYKMFGELPSETLKSAKSFRV